MPLTRARRIVLSVAAAALSCAGAVSPANAAASRSPVTGGHVKIALSSATRHGLDTAGVDLVATSVASYHHGNLKLPIGRGTATPPTYLVHLGGGFKFAKGSDSVKVSHVTIDTAAQTGSAKIGGAGAITAFKFKVPSGGNGGPGQVQFGYDKLTLTKTARQKLDSALATKVFARHPTLGKIFFDITFKA
jgi:hypothetical protein